MKHPLLRWGVVLFVGLFAGKAWGQQYITSYTTNSGTPNGVNTGSNTAITGWTIALDAGLAANAWSAKQTIPFTFNFYGAPVTKFLVSANGLLTFDTTATGTPANPTGTTLPDAGLPDKTVAAFWANFTGLPPTASNDRVYVTTLGTAPNRQVWVRWYSFEWGATGDFAYVSIVLEETTNKIYAVDEYISANLTGTGVTGIQVNATTAYQPVTGGTFASNTSSSATDDDYVSFEYFAAGACIPPTNPMTTAVAGASATVSWNAGTGSTYNLEYGAPGFTPGTGTLISGIAGTSTNITGLSSATTYSFYVQSDCGGGTLSGWAGPVSFTTMFAPHYLQPFASYPPTGWTEAQGNIGEPTTLTGTSSSWLADGWLNSGTTGAVRANVYGTAADEWMFSPAIDMSVGGPYQLEFDIALMQYAGSGAVTMDADDSIMVVISTDAGATWNRSQALKVYHAGNQPSNVGQHEVIDLTGYTGVIKIGFYGESTVSGADMDLMIDNVEIKAIPSCQSPFSLASGTITASSFDVTFDGAGASSFDLEYGPAGFTLGTGTSVALTSVSTTITGLTGNTTYDVYVRANCGPGNSSAYAGPLSVTTLCNIVSSFPYTENFDGGTWVSSTTSGTPGTMDPCWSRNPGTSGTYSWMVHTGSTSSSFTGANAANSGSNYMYTEASNGSAGNVATMNIVATDLSALTNPQLTFFYHMYGANMGNLFIEASLDNGATYVKIDSIKGQQQTANGDPWMKHSTNLTTYISANTMLRFRAVRGSDYTGDMSIDDVVIEETPSCFAPTLVQGSIASATSLQIAISGATTTNFNLEYGASGFTPGTGTAMSATNDTVIIGSLTGGTTYDIYVQADCGSGDISSWVGPISVYLGYCSPNPSSVDGSGITNVTVGTINNTSATEPGNYGDYSSQQTDIAQSTTVNVDITFATGYTYDTKIWVDWNDDYDFDDAGEEVYVGMSTSANPTTLNASFVVPASAPLGLHRMRIGGQDVGPPVPCYTGSWGSYEDYTVNVIAAPSCLAPTSLMAYNKNQSGFDLAIMGAAVSNFNVEYGAGGFTPGTGTAMAVTNDTVNFTGLTAGATYDVYVQADCGSGTLSSWFGPYAVVLNYCSPNPSSVDGSGITNVTVGTINNTTGTEPGNYGDYSSMQTDIAQTTTVNVNITFATGYTYDTKIWIDWNDDYDFDDAGEEVYVGMSASTNPTTLFASFVVPAGAPLGMHRMRIGGQDVGPPVPCYTGTWGSYEDYTVNVVPPPSCSDPTGLAANATGTTGAIAYWTTTASQTNVEYGPAGFTPGTGTLMIVNNDSITLSGLTSGTAYDIYIQDSCSNGAMSNWVGPVSVTTLLCDPASGCSFTFSLLDTYGDGWNNGIVTIYQNNVATGTLGYPCGGFSGCSQLDSVVALCDGANVVLVLSTEGSYPEEIGLNVSDSYGVPVGSYTASSSAATGDTLLTFTASCAAPSSCPITDQPMAMTETSCGPTPVTFNATAPTNPNYGVVWLNADSAAIATGLSFTTGNITANTTYYAAYGALDGPAQHVGPLSSIAASGYGNFTNGQWFTAYDYFSLDSLVVNSNGNTVNGFVQISEATNAGGGAVIASSPFSVTGAGDHQIEVGIPIAPGTYYININFTAGTTGQLFRTTSGAVYPYTISNLVSIDSTNFGTPGAADTRYYYTFDWTVTPACVGPLSTANAVAGTLPSTALPYEENFDGGLPCNWSVEDSANGGAVWQNVANYGVNGLDSNFMFIDDDAVGSSVISETYLVSPSFNAVGFDTLKVSFDHYYRHLTGTVGNVDVWDGTNWVNVASYTSTQGGWATPVNEVLDITAYQNADLRVRFHYDDGGAYGWYWAMDNFNLEGVQTPCQDVVVSVITDIYGSEVTWSIVDSISGLVYATGGPYADVSPYNAAAATHIDTVCLPENGTFVFRIEDSYGDGLFDGTNNGTYDLSVLCPAGPLSKLSGTGALPFDPGGATAFIPSYDSVVFDLDCTVPVVNHAVTFQVDMTNETVSANGVHVAGSFQDEAGFPADWDPSTTALTDPDGDNIYTVTVMIPAGSYEFKYVNGNAWGSDEAVPAACATGGNRTASVSGDTTLSVVCYASCTTCTTPPAFVDVTLQVNMENVTVSANGVHVAGSFQGWNPSATPMTDPDGDGIYTVTVQMPENDTTTYTYINGNDWPDQENSSGLGTCGVDNGFGGFNRFVVTGTSNQVVPVVCFEECEDCDIGLEEINGGYVDFTVFPNPSSGLVVIENIGNGVSGATVEVLGLNGKVLVQTELKLDSSKQHRLDLTNFSKGLYVVRIISDQRVEVHHLAIQ